MRWAASTSIAQPTFYEMSTTDYSPTATAYEVTDAPRYMAVVENERSPYNNTTAFGVTDEDLRNNRAHSGSKGTKQVLNLAAWNVRTTNDSINSLRPERATAIICRALEEADVDICALSEVRRPGTGNVKERSHTIYWSGGKDKTAGVGFAVSNKFSHINPVPISDRIMTARVELKNNVHLTLISVYGPTMQRPELEKEQFYEQLGECITSAKGDAVIVLGDFNARVGKDWESWPSVIGRHGVGHMNSNGLMLLEFCTRMKLSIMGTMFQLKNRLKNTWQHPRSKHWHQLDHVLANSQARQFIRVTKVNPSADCFTDHRLLLCKCSIVIKSRKKSARPPCKPDTHLTDKKKHMLETFLEEKIPDCESSWDDLKEVLQNAADHIFEKKKRKSEDWFDDQEKEIQELLKEKRKTGDIKGLREEIRKMKNTWFQQKAEEAERYAQEKNNREFYATLNAVYGPKSKNVHPVKSKQGELLSAPEDIKDRWVEHFDELLNQPTNVDWEILNEIDQLPTIDEFDNPVTMEELETALKNTKLRKSPGPDGIIPEVIVHGGKALWTFLLTLFNLFWLTEKLPSDLTDANISILFKKGDRSLCENYRGISLLSVVGKIFADVILQRLQRLAEKIYPESQSGYRSNRSTIDGIFTLRQIMEKCREQRCNLHIAFIDFTKAFDCVNRELLYAILQKLGCPEKFVRIIKKLYSDVHARLLINGELSDSINYNSGVKQGCKLAPTLFGIYAAVLLYLAFEDVDPSCSIKVRFRYDGDIFDLRRLKAKTKILTDYIREAQYADDIAIFSNESSALQTLLSAYNTLSLKMGLRINIKKTETMSVGEQVDFYIDGNKLCRVDRFKYLGSYITKDCKVDEELKARIQAASCAVGRLRQRVFQCRDLTSETKLKVYIQCVTPLLLYGSETWTLYRRHIKQLRTIQQRHLRSILHIRWDHFVTNDEVLEQAKTVDIETTLVKNRLRWVGHVVRMEATRPVKELFFGELEDGSRSTGRPQLRYKDTIKDILRRADVLHNWRDHVDNRHEWRQFTHDVSMKIDHQRKEISRLRREKRHQQQSR